MKPNTSYVIFNSYIRDLKRQQTNNQRFFVMIIRACWEFNTDVLFAEDRGSSPCLEREEDISNVVVIAFYQTKC